MVIKQTVKERGYIYIWMLFAVMLTGVMLAAAGLVWQTEVRREKEQELLFAGDQFRQAIESYYNASQTAVEGSGRYPESLEQLLKDERLPGIKRHLRKIYNDPLTNSRDWGLIRQEDGGITGVYSLSTDRPIKQANFSAEYAAFESAESYQSWKFTPAGGSADGQGMQQTGDQKNSLGGAVLTPQFPAASFDPLSQNQSAPDTGIRQLSRNPVERPIGQ